MEVLCLSSFVFSRYAANEPETTKRWRCPPASFHPREYKATQASVFGAAIRSVKISSSDNFKIHYTAVAVSSISIVKAEFVNFECARFTGDAVQAFVPMRGTEEFKRL